MFWRGRGGDLRLVQDRNPNFAYLRLIGCQIYSRLANVGLPDLPPSFWPICSRPVAARTSSAGIRDEGGALDAPASRSTGAGLVPETSPDFQNVTGRLPWPDPDGVPPPVQADQNHRERRGCQERLNKHPLVLIADRPACGRIGRACFHLARSICQPKLRIGSSSPEHRSKFEKAVLIASGRSRYGLAGRADPRHGPGVLKGLKAGPDHQSAGSGCGQSGISPVESRKGSWAGTPTGGVVTPAQRRGHELYGPVWSGCMVPDPAPCWWRRDERRV